MKQKILNALVLVSLMVVSALAPAVPVAAAGNAGCPGGSTSKGHVLEGVGQTGSGCNDDAVTSTVTAFIKILSYFAGVVAVIMVIIAGFKYITSNGDSGKIGSAKTTLIYSLVGLAIVALAQALIHFVLGRV